MRLNCDNIRDEDKNRAINVKNYILSGNRVIGDPGEGLRHTLAELEKRKENQEVSIIDWNMKDVELETQISMTKAGIEGEVKLCEYLQTLLKYDDKLKGIVAFASLSYDTGKAADLGYIPDTDTLLVYGRHILIIDAKNLKLKPNQEIILVGNSLVDPDKGKELLTVNPSTHIWEKVMADRGIPLESIDGYVCIVNETPVNITRDEEWYASNIKPIHICELREILEDWVSNKDGEVMYLDTLTEIAKAQIKKEKNMNITEDEWDKIKRMYGI